MRIASRSSGAKSEPGPAFAPRTDHFRVALDRVVDGDTIDVGIALGLGVVKDSERLRLLGVNTPETRGAEREAGLAATEFTRQQVRPPAGDRTCLERRLTLNDALVAQGWGHAY